MLACYYINRNQESFDLCEKMKLCHVVCVFQGCSLHMKERAICLYFVLCSSSMAPSIPLIQLLFDIVYVFLNLCRLFCR